MSVDSALATGLRLVLELQLLTAGFYTATAGLAGLGVTPLGQARQL
jgi:hypothetical protein